MDLLREKKSAMLFWSGKRPDICETQNNKQLTGTSRYGG